MQNGLLITADFLKSRGACEGSVSLFGTIWPDGARITLKNVQRACDAGFDLSWFAQLFCNARERACYNRRYGALLMKEDAAYRAFYDEHPDFSLGSAAQTRDLKVLMTREDRKRRRGLVDAFMWATRRFQSPRTRAEVERREVKRRKRSKR